MSAAEALARIGTAGVGEEANEFRAQIRSWISASVPPGLADMAQRNMPGIPRDEHATAMASPEYREWEQQLLDAQLICRQQAFLTSRPDTIWGGTAEIQRNIIAERLLGLPKEPRGNRAPPNRPAHLTAREHTPPTSGGSR